MKLNTCEMIVLFTGLCQPDPGGVATFGWVAYNQGELWRHGGGILGNGAKMTTTRAEYQGLLSSMYYLIRIAGYRKELELRSDSKIVINQMIGTYKVYGRDLQSVHRETLRIATVFQDTGFIWIPKAENREAEKMARAYYAKYIEDQLKELEGS